MARLILRLILILIMFPVVATVVSRAETATRYPAAPRIVAVGDLHGDIHATRTVLRLAGVIDENDTWAGGETVLVQCGDQLDRGGSEQAILTLFSRLKQEAAAAGGALFCLNGNHELMNIASDVRYVTEGGFRDFQGAAQYDPADTTYARYEPYQRDRIAAFRPGGPYALALAERNVILIVGENVFVHGGVLPANVDYGLGGVVPANVDCGLEKINAEVSRWLRNEGPKPGFINGDDSMVWARDYSCEVDESDCEQLAAVLSRLGAKRMVVGHTVHGAGITSYCDGQVWCIDTGMAAHYGGFPQALEIRGDRITVIGDVPAEQQDAAEETYKRH